MLGVVMIGNPIAPALNGRGILEVNRLCICRDVPTALAWNASSQLYGWAAREARRRGWKHIISYTRVDEQGTALRAAGWTKEATVRGCGWHSGKRSWSNRNSFVDKIRWGKARKALQPNSHESRKTPGQDPAGRAKDWLHDALCANGLCRPDQYGLRGGISGRRFEGGRVDHIDIAGIGGTS
jgi:hypothetical protein